MARCAFTATGVLLWRHAPITCSSVSERPHPPSPHRADVDFNPQIDRQAEDRCHRLGQTRPVKARCPAAVMDGDGQLDERCFEQLGLSC